jgi:hypothetical protein
VRTAGPLGTLADFEMALGYAKQGGIVSDTGLADEVLEALDTVARAAPDPPQELLDAARETFLRSRRRRPQRR